LKINVEIQTINEATDLKINEHSVILSLTGRFEFY